MEWNVWTTVFTTLYLAHNGFELLLDLLQNRHLKNRRDKVPKHLEGKVDIGTIRRAVFYNRDKLRLGIVARLLGSVALVAMILFGFGWIDDISSQIGFGSLLTGLCFFGIVGAASFVIGLPLELVSTFFVEEKHGFNKQTLQMFIFDKLKEILISSILGAALLSIILVLMGQGGEYWWLLAFGAVTAIQLLVLWIYPLLIMPLFNKFTPVEQDLAADVAGLAGRVGFPLAAVMSMDGSKRSAHSNAFFIGLKGARRIVLYDTLIQKVGRPELLAVLAHEFGHFKLRHLTKRLALILVSLLAVFAGLAYLREQSAVYSGLGFERVSDHAALVVFGLLLSEAVAPAGWLLRYLSRRDERGADRFAVDAVGNGIDLAGALVALTKQNLSSPGSHKLYRAYYNSHPPLKERLKNIRAHARAKGLPVS